MRSQDKRPRVMLQVPGWKSSLQGMRGKEVSIGKRFEWEIRKSFVDQYPDAFALRIRDNTWKAAKNGVAKGSVKTPADLLICMDSVDLLIECKTFKGPSMPMANVAEHQVESLTQFSRISQRHRGILALFPHRGKRKVRGTESYLVTIEDWETFFSRNSRKSYPLQEMMKCPTMRWEKGRWDLSSAVPLLEKSTMMASQG